MDPRVRDFVDSYKNKPMPKMTVEEFIRTHNREIWQKCSHCGNIEDVRLTFFCPDCGARLDKNINKKKLKPNDT